MQTCRFFLLLLVVAPDAVAAFKEKNNLLKWPEWPNLQPLQWSCTTLKETQFYSKSSWGFLFFYSNKCQRKTTHHSPAATQIERRHIRLPLSRWLSVLLHPTCCLAQMCDCVQVFFNSHIYRKPLSCIYVAAHVCKFFLSCKKTNCHSVHARQVSVPFSSCSRQRRAFRTMIHSGDYSRSAGASLFSRAWLIRGCHLFVCLCVRGTAAWKPGQYRFWTHIMWQFSSQLSIITLQMCFISWRVGTKDRLVLHSEDNKHIITIITLFCGLQELTFYTLFFWFSFTRN